MPSLSAAAVRTAIHAGRTDPVYLLQGDDDVEKAALAGEFAELIDEGLRAFNVERIHCGDMTTGDRLADGVATLVAAARTLPMMAPRRLVMVTQAEMLLAPKRESEAAARAFDDLEAFLQAPEPQTTVVFVAGPLDKRTRMFKLLSKHAIVVDCGAPEDAAGAERWVRARVAAAGVEMEPAGARTMAVLAGFPNVPQRDGHTGDIGRLRGEVDRLLLYAMGQKRISAADVREVAGPAALQDNWAMVNALERGNAAEALKQLVLSLDAGAAPEALLGQLGWFVRTKFPEGAPARVKAGVDAVFQTDLELKRSNRSGDQPRLLLERLVIELCGERRARPG